MYAAEYRNFEIYDNLSLAPSILRFLRERLVECGT